VRQQLACAVAAVLGSLLGVGLWPAPGRAQGLTLAELLRSRGGPAGMHVQAWGREVAQLQRGPRAEEEPLRVDEAVRLAIARFPALQAARQEVEAARARVTLRGAHPNPRLAAKRESGETSDKAEGLEIHQDVELFGQWLIRRSKAGWELEGKEGSFRREVLDLTLEVQKAFFDVLAAETIAEVNRENLTVAEGLLRAAKRRFELGDAPRLEWVRSEVEYTRALQDVLRTQRELADKRAVLHFFLGRDLSTPIQLAEPPPSPLAGQQVEDPQRLARERRPELPEAMAAARASDRQVTLAWMDILPSFSVAYETTRSRASPAQESEQKLTLRASIPIFDFGAIRGQIREARAQRGAAGFRLDLVHQRLALEVQEAHLALAEAEKQLESYRGGILAQAEEVLKLTLGGYERGALTFLDVLEAQRSFRVTKSGLALAQRHYRQSAAQLERAIGGAP